MRRILVGMTSLALLFAGLSNSPAPGQDDKKPDTIKLDTLNTDLLRKIVKAHLEGAYGKDRAKDAHVKALPAVPGGVPGKLGYAFKAGKPDVTFDAAAIPAPAQDVKDRATAAIRDLVSSAFGSVAANGFEDGGKKHTLAAADARALGEAVRVLWAAAPPPVDPIKPLIARIDKLAKDLDALRKIEPRVAEAEKTIKELEKLRARIDELGKQLKDLPAALKALKALETVPGQVKTLDENLKKLSSSLQKLEEKLKGLETLPGQIKTLEGQIKGIDARVKTVEGQVKTLDGQIKGIDTRVKTTEGKVKTLEGRLDAIEKTVNDLDPRLKKLEAALKTMADDLKKNANNTTVLQKRLDAVEDQLKKNASGNAQVLDRLKKLEDQLKKETEERFKRLEEQLKKETEERNRAIKKIEKMLEPVEIGPVLPLMPTLPALPHWPHCPTHHCPTHHCPTMHHHHEAPAPPVPQLNFHGKAYILLPGIGKGGFGEEFPVLMLTPLPQHGHHHNHGVYHSGSNAIPGATVPSTTSPTLPNPTTPPVMPPAKDNGKKVREAEKPATSTERLVSLRREREIRDTTLAPGDEAGADRLFWQGCRLHWQRKHEEALTRFTAAIRAHEKDARFWYYRSLSESALGRTRAAAESLHRAVELHAQGLPGADEIGQALERVQGDARRQLRQALDSYRADR